MACSCHRRMLPQSVEIYLACHRIHVMEMLRLALHCEAVLALSRLPHIHHIAHVMRRLQRLHILSCHAHVRLAHWVMHMVGRWLINVLMLMMLVLRLMLMLLGRRRVVSNWTHHHLGHWRNSVAVDVVRILHSRRHHWRRANEGAGHL